jgi:SAM-dependent methyltransferase
MLQPFGDAVLAAASLSPGERVADVGCGNGALTIEAARRVGPTGTALGIDISTPMLGLARRRATEAGTGNVEFVEADAQVHPFGGGSLDAILSCFGVMFFDWCGFWRPGRLQYGISPSRGSPARQRRAPAGDSPVGVEPATCRRPPPRHGRLSCPPGRPPG